MLERERENFMDENKNLIPTLTFHHIVSYHNTNKRGITNAILPSNNILLCTQEERTWKIKWSWHNLRFHLSFFLCLYWGAGSSNAAPTCPQWIIWLAHEGVTFYFNLLWMIIRYTYSNLRIFNAHVFAEDSSKLFRITLKVVQVLEFNDFRYIQDEPSQPTNKYSKSADNSSNLMIQHLCSNLTHKNWSFTSVWFMRRSSCKKATT